MGDVDAWERWEREQAARRREAEMARQAARARREAIARRWLLRRPSEHCDRTER